MLSFLNGNFSIDFVLSPKILWGIFGIAMAVFVIFTAVLLFHWQQYGMKSRGIFLAEIIYFAGAGIIIFLSVISLLLYAN